MSTYEKRKMDSAPAVHEPLLTRNELIAMAGLILVAMGSVFFLAEAGSLSWSSPWWTLFIGIPGLVFLGAGVLSVRHIGHLTAVSIAQFLIGGIACLLALSFIVDPTWSFTRNWTLFQGQFWSTAWQWMLLLFGVGIIVFAVITRSLATGIIGGVIGLVGVIFLLDISWNAVWPLVIVALGVAVLALLFRRNPAT